MSLESTGERTVDERLEAIEQAVKDRPEVRLDPKGPADFAGDKAGAGRYILACSKEYKQILDLWSLGTSTIFTDFDDESCPG